MKATKKKVTIECLKWTGVNFDEIKEFCGDVAEFHSCVETGCNELFIKTLEGTHHASFGDYIIKGVNGEFYPCKPDIFEKTYEIEEKCEAIIEAPGTSHGFDWAIQMLKDGKKVQRKGWNGKGMFITLQPGSTVDGELMRNEPAKEFYTGKKCNICAHIDMKAADDTYVVGWLASQTDMLADDWQIAE